LTLAVSQSRIAPAPSRVTTSATAFYLFILLNAILFIRPAEVVPALEGLPIYQAVILACIASSWGAIRAQLTWQSLKANPLTACVLGILVALVLSHLAHLSFFGIKEGGVEFAKVVIYYLLLVGVVDSADRLRQFLVWVCAFMVGLTLLAVLNYNHVVDIPSMAPVIQVQEGEIDPNTGEDAVLPRLCASGIFSDPNDLCLSLARGAYICFFLVIDRPRRILSWLWLAPVPLFVYALKLTYSRGGLLAFGAGLVAMFYGHLGWRKTALVLVILSPVGLSLFAGRQLNIEFSDSNDTSQSRIQLWSDSFDLMRTSPLFGIGEGQITENLGLVAHNSFVHSYAELGVLGGTVFTAIWFLSVVITFRLTTDRALRLPAEVRRMGPCMLAIVVSYIVGMMSLSRCYIVPTYTVVGMVAAYGRIGAVASSAAVPPLDRRLLWRLVLVSAAWLIALMLVVHEMVKWH
jgi:O-antigen ligase